MTAGNVAEAMAALTTLDKRYGLTNEGYGIGDFYEDLKEKGYILDYKFEEDTKQGLIKIALKYHPVTKVPAIRNLTRISKPGLRKYAGVEAMPRVINGLGIAILSTSKGVMTDKEAKTEKVGGEVLCYVY